MGVSMEELMGPIYRRNRKGADECSEEAASGAPRAAIRMERMGDPSCFARITGQCGETMEIYLRVDGEQITDATFFTEGCQFSVLCGAVAALMARGKTIDEAVQIGGDTILGFLKDIPMEESHCAHLAAEALQVAIHDWMLK